MTDLENLQLDKWRGSLEPERSGTGWRVAIIIAVLIVVGVAGYFLLWRRGQHSGNDVRVHTEQPVAAPSPAKPVAEAGENINLPPLEQSDTIVRQLVTQLSSNPKIAAWLTTDQLIRNFTVVVFNVANGKSPSNHLAKVKPGEKFQVIERGSDIVIDPRSYHRYDAYADAIDGLDAHGAARLYATLKPRIQDGYRELGYPDGNFDPVLERAIVELLKTPVVEGNVALSSKSVAYEYADPRLQSLSSVQRQFLRMGPRNVKLVQAKLREIAPLLGISPGSLPH
jgi:hypothetical protein